MEELAKEYGQKVRQLTIEENLVHIYNEMLITVLAVAYGIKPKYVFSDHMQPIDTLFATYENTESLNHAIEDFFSHESSKVVNIGDLVKWNHEYNRTVEYC
jgi:hypothetical protein